MNVNVKRENFIKNRIISGYSQRSLSKLIGASSAYISQIESGIRKPSPAFANKICELLKVHFDDIFFIQCACKSEHLEL